MRARRRPILAAIGLPALALAVWAFVIEPASLRSTAHELTIPGWPAACDGLRIAVVGDLHTGSPHNGLPNVARVVELVRRAQPDLVLLAGDFVITGVVGGTAVPPEEIAPVLGGLSAPLGVFAVLGNHDWWFGAPRVRRALEAAGIPVLEDQSRPLAHGACRFWLAGIGDFWEGRHDVAAALADVPPGAPVVAFTHNPDVFPDVPARVLLTIAAHTHGGQVALPLIGRPLVPSRYGQRYAIGHVVEEGRHLFVSSGIGTSIFPVRFRVPPEVSLLTVRGS